MKTKLSLLTIFSLAAGALFVHAEDLKHEDSAMSHEYVFARNELDIIKKETIWLELRLSERANKPFSMLVEWIRQGVESNALTPYKNAEDCANDIPMTKDEFFKSLKDPNIISDDNDADSHGGEVTAKKDDSGRSTELVEHVPTREEQFFSKDISTLELQVDVITNSVTCEQYLKIETIKLIVPASKFPNGIQKEVAVFKFEELMKYFETLPKEKSWINPENKIRNMKYSDAFKTVSLWYPQTYLIATEKDRLYGYEQDPNKPLDLRKEKILVGEVFMWAY